MQRGHIRHCFGSTGANPRPIGVRRPPGPGRPATYAAYLVPRDRAAAFADRVRRPGGAREAGVRVELTGPWAPYSFAEGEAGAAAGPSSAGADPSGPRAGEEP